MPAPLASVEAIRQQRAVKSATMKRRRETLLARGLCGNCGNNPIVAGRTKCEICLERQRALWRQRKQRRMCARCGEARAMSGKVACAACAEMNQQPRATRARQPRPLALTVYVPSELSVRLRALSALEHVSISALVRDIIDAYLNDLDEQCA